MSLRHALLGLLGDDERASGYELLKVFDSSLVNVWPATQSQVYTELNRLAADGLISVVAEGPRGRRDYAITESGRAELRDWLDSAPRPRPHRSDLLLRVFFLDEMPAGKAREMLLRHGERVRAHLDGLCEIRAATSGGEDPVSRNGRIALEFGVRKAQMELDWVMWSLGQLSEQPGDS